MMDTPSDHEIRNVAQTEAYVLLMISNISHQKCSPRDGEFCAQEELFMYFTTTRS